MTLLDCKEPNMGFPTVRGDVCDKVVRRLFLLILGIIIYSLEEGYDSPRAGVLLLALIRPPQLGAKA